MKNFLCSLCAVLAAATSIRAEKPDASSPHWPVCDRARFLAPPGGEQDMVGGKFEGSNVSRHEGFETLAEIKTAPAKGEWGELRFDNKKLYRWLHYVGPEGAKGKAGKIEFYSGDKLLAGENKGEKFTSILNDRLNEQFAGFDVFYAATSQRPNFTPANADQDGPVDVTLSIPRGATVRYTLDGSWPKEDHGEVYSKPIHLEKSTTVVAVAFQPNLTPSLPVAVTYLIKGSSKPGLSSAHVGNSLTGTTGGFYRFARTAGYSHNSVAFLRPGALTRELWAVATGEYKNDKLAASKEQKAQDRGALTWDDYWNKVGKVDLITLQPRDFDLDKEIAAEVSFLKKFREKSPDLQPWLYCEWVELKRDRPSDHGMVPSFQMKKTFPALTWEESMGAMLLYMEELQHRLTAAYPEGKPAHIIPAALAMGWAKHFIDHGQFPGVKPGSFYPLLFNDQVHPADSPIHGSANGAFLVDMTWFSAFYREPSEGKVLPVETTYTPEQAQAVERLAWDVIKNYPDCGLYEEGKEPCGKPEIVNDGKQITLKSSTPGVWFRYTLDGTEPTRTRGYVYCGVISVQPDIHVKTIAYKSGMADSAVVEDGK